MHVVVGQLKKNGSGLTHYPPLEIAGTRDPPLKKAARLVITYHVVRTLVQLLYNRMVDNQ